jgi:hypothetical protein
VSPHYKQEGRLVPFRFKVKGEIKVKAAGEAPASPRAFFPRPLALWLPVENKSVTSWNSRDFGGVYGYEGAGPAGRGEVLFFRFGMGGKSYNQRTPTRWREQPPWEIW